MCGPPYRYGPAEAPGIRGPRLVIGRTSKVAVAPSDDRRSRRLPPSSCGHGRPPQFALPHIDFTCVALRGCSLRRLACRMLGSADARPTTFALSRKRIRCPLFDAQVVPQRGQGRVFTLIHDRIKDAPAGARSEACGDGSDAVDIATMPCGLDAVRNPRSGWSVAASFPVPPKHRHPYCAGRLTGGQSWWSRPRVVSGCGGGQDGGDVTEEGSSWPARYSRCSPRCSS